MKIVHFVSRKELIQGIHSVAVKLAMRDQDWVHRARESIVIALSEYINRSNGISVHSPTTYKYYVSKGNNSQLVKKCLSSKWWWASVEKEQLQTCNLL